MNKVLIIVAVLIVSLSAGWVFLASGVDDEHADEHGDADHDHSAHAAPENLSVDELFRLECEHAIPTHTCDECRYELGLVRVTSDLLKINGGPVDLENAARTDIPTLLEVAGEIQLNGNAELHVSPVIEGVVTAVNVDLGDRVKKGDPLFEIASPELGQAVADFRRLEALTELSRRNFEREKALFEKKIASEVEFIESQMTFEQYRADLSAAEQKLHVMGVSEDEIRTGEIGDHNGRIGQLAYRSRLEGVVIEKHASIGELAEPGKDVFLIADLSTLWVWLDIYEQDLAALLDADRLGPIPVEISTLAFPGETFSGTIDHIGSVMNEQSRTVRVRVLLQNPQNRLRPGMFCQGRIAIGAGENALALPREAVQNDEGRDFVFRHVRDDFYLRTFVTAGRQFQNRRIILSGISETDSIVTSGAFMLKSDILREKMGAGCAD